MLSIAAWIGFIGYVVGCYCFGSRFPFYKLELYAGIANRRQSAVPLFLVDGEESDIWEYTRFSGIEPDAFLNDSIPTSVTWMVEEAARWVRSHWSEPGEAPGPHRVAFGFRLLSVDEHGEIVEEHKMLTEGFAWKAN